MTDKGTNIGYAMLPVALSFENITGEIAGKLGVPLKAAGMKAGADAGAAIAAGVDQAKGKVMKQTQGLYPAPLKILEVKKQLYLSMRLIMPATTH